MNIIGIREKLDKMNSRCQKIVHLLYEHGELSQDSLADILNVSKRVVRYNVKILKDANIVKAIPNFDDMRLITYTLRD